MKDYWCIPPKENAELMTAMEDIFDIYELPYNSELPVVCIDENLSNAWVKYVNRFHYVPEITPGLISSISVRALATFLFLQNPYRAGVTVASKKADSL